MLGGFDLSGRISLFEATVVGGFDLGWREIGGCPARRGSWGGGPPLETCQLVGVGRSPKHREQGTTTCEEELPEEDRPGRDQQ